MITEVTIKINHLEGANIADILVRDLDHESRPAYRETLRYLAHALRCGAKIHIERE